MNLFSSSNFPNPAIFSGALTPPLSPPPAKPGQLPPSPITPVNLSTSYAGSPIIPKVENGRPIREPRVKRQLKFNFAPSESDSVHTENVITNATWPEKLKLKNPYELVKEYGEQGILMNHVKKRVDIFFQQLVTVYGTGLHFELGATLEQGESGKALHVEHEGANHKICTRNAAHSSTLPCLTAYDKALWEGYQKGENEKPVGVVFAKESALFLASNATIVMPREVNEADMAIDGDRRTPGGLREKALTIINRASAREINPEKGLLLFIEALQTSIDEKVGIVPKAGVQSALEYYQIAVKEIKSETEDPCYFNTLLDLHSIKEKDNDLREPILEARYRAIRRQHLTQTIVRKKVRDLQEQIFSKLKKGSHYKLEAFQESLIENMPTKEDRIRMIKILNFSKTDIAQFKKGPLTRLTNMRATVSKQDKLFKVTTKDIAALFAESRLCEMKTRARITQKLRKANGWSQEDLKNKIINEYPDIEITDQTIERLENTSLPTSDEWAKALSTVFKINSTIYLPNFFYS